MFEARVQVVLDRVKAAAKQPGVNEILLPGERSAARAAAAEAAGAIDVEDNLLAGLKQMAATAPAAPQPRPGKWGIATRLAHPTSDGVEDPYSSMAVPLYQTATFKQPSATENGAFDYTRSGNPTRKILEANLADLEGGARGLAFCTGMAAIAAACRLVKAGGHIVAGDDIYGGTSRLLSSVLPGLGVDVTNVDHTDLAAFKRAFQQGRTKLAILESPTNPRMQARCLLPLPARVAASTNPRMQARCRLPLPAHSRAADAVSGRRIAGQSTVARVEFGRRYITAHHPESPSP